MADASGVLNLAALGRPVLAAMSLDVVLPPAFELERLEIFSLDDPARLDVCDVEVLKAIGLRITLASITEVAAAERVRYATLIDDGHAQCLAIAKDRGIPVFTDDARGMLIVRQLGIELVTTLDVLKTWSERNSRAGLRHACARLRACSLFRAPTHHPLAEWFGQASECGT